MACNATKRVKKSLFNNWLRSKYGLNEDGYKTLLRKQHSACAICYSVVSDTRKLDVDHDHKTKQVRGLLCGRCNRAIGLLEDSPGLLARAMDYLETSLLEFKPRYTSIGEV